MAILLSSSRWVVLLLKIQHLRLIFKGNFKHFSYQWITDLTQFELALVCSSHVISLHWSHRAEQLFFRKINPWWPAGCLITCTTVWKYFHNPQRLSWPSWQKKKHISFIRYMIKNIFTHFQNCKQANFRLGIIICSDRTGGSMIACKVNGKMRLDTNVSGASQTETKLWLCMLKQFQLVLYESTW